MSDNVLIALINAAALVLLLLLARFIDRRAGSRRVTQSIDALRNRVSATESSLTAGLGAVGRSLQKLEDNVERLHEGQVDIRERLARREGRRTAPAVGPRGAGQMSDTHHQGRDHLESQVQTRQAAISTEDHHFTFERDLGWERGDYLVKECME